MHIEIWSDFVCPFCYIGKRRLMKALKQFPHGDEVQVTFRSFQLDPNIPRDGNPDVHQMLMNKYGLTREQALANTENIVRQAEAEGLHFDFEKSIQTNTFDAHRLAHYAKGENKDLALTERLLRAHFTEGLHLGDWDVLARLAADVGLDGDEARQVLALRDTFAAEVQADIARAQQLGVRGVPFFLLADKYGVSGAQPPAVFSQAIEQSWAEHQQEA